MKRTMQGWAVLVLIVGLVGVADARMRGGRMHGDGELGHFAHRLASLNLTENQQDIFDTIHNRLRKETIRKRADVKVAEVELQELLDKEPADLKGAEEKIRQIASIQAEIRVLHLKAAGEFRGKLTAEQQEKFDELENARFMGLGKGMGGDGGPMGHHGMMGGGGGGKGMMGSGGCPMMQGMNHGDGKTAGASEAKTEKGGPSSSAHSGHQHN